MYEKGPYEENICFLKKYILFQKTYILLKKIYILFQKHMFFGTYIFAEKHIFFVRPLLVHVMFEKGPYEKYMFFRKYIRSKKHMFLKKYIYFFKKYICFLKKYVYFFKKHIFFRKAPSRTPYLQGICPKNLNHIQLFNIMLLLKATSFAPFSSLYQPSFLDSCESLG